MVNNTITTQEPGPPELGNVTWNKRDGGWCPLYKWKSITFEGPVRPFRAFLEGEPITVLRYFMCRISEHLFDVAPLQMVLDNGPVKFAPDERFNKIPYLKETASSWEMSDGSMKIAKGPQPPVEE